MTYPITHINLLSTPVSMRLYLVEPNPANQDILKKHFGGKPNVHILPFACSEENGETTFYTQRTEGEGNEGGNQHGSLGVHQIPGKNATDGGMKFTVQVTSIV